MSHPNQKLHIESIAKLDSDHAQLTERAIELDSLRKRLHATIRTNRALRASIMKLNDISDSDLDAG